MIYLIVLLGLVLRLISINQSLWIDEATSAQVAKMSVSDIFTKFLPGDFHPPLYYLVLKYWSSVFGYSEVAIRIPSVIFGLATILFIYLIAKTLFDKKTAIIASALSASSGLLIYYSQEARMYNLAALLVSISIYLFLNKKWFWLSISILLLGMTDYVSLLILPVIWFFGRKDIRKIFLSHIPLFIFFGLWLPIFISQLQTGFSVSGSAWWHLLGTVSIKNFALIPVKFVLGRISFDNKILYAGVAGLAVGLYGYLVFLARKSSTFVLGWLTTPIVFGVCLSFKIPTLSYFRFMFCLPALYILTAAGIQKLTKLKRSVLILVITVNLVSSAYYLFTPRFWREDWRSAATTIGSDEVVMPANSQAEALEYYGKGNQTVYYKGLIGGQKEIWLSRYVWQVFDPSDLARKKVESLGYNKIAEDDFNGVVFWKYTK